MNANSITLYHPDKTGSGSALRMELTPFRVGVPESGKLTFLISSQDGDGFSFADSIGVRLNFDEVSQVLQVFRGETKSLRSGCVTRRNCVFNMVHTVEPEAGYAMIISNGDKTVSFTLKPHEALGLSLAIEVSMSRLVFDVD